MYLIDEFIFLFLVSLLNEIRTLDESRFSSFLFLALTKRMRRWGESKIFLCNPNGGKFLLRPASGIV